MKQKLNWIRNGQINGWSNNYIGLEKDFVYSLFNKYIKFTKTCQLNIWQKNTFIADDCQSFSVDRIQRNSMKLLGHLKN